MIKPGIEGNFFNLIKNIYSKSIANIILRGERLNAFLLILGKKGNMPALITLIQHSARSSSQCNKAIKGIQIKQEETKLP